MREFKVYLAGPITGLTYGESTDWRVYAKQKLSQRVVETSQQREGVATGIHGYSPMRGKDYLHEVGRITNKPYDDYVLSTGRGITERDRWDVRTADIVLANFLGAEAISVGTVIELGWADAFRTPVAVAMEKGNVHEHAILDELYGWRSDSLDEAIEVVKAVLLP